MSIFNSIPPKIKQYHLIKWLKNNYTFFKNKDIYLKKLNSERDKNYLISVNLKSNFVVKISNPLESKNLLLMQDYVLTNLNQSKSISKLIPNKIHKTIKLYQDELVQTEHVRFPQSWDDMIEIVNVFDKIIK